VYPCIRWKQKYAEIGDTIAVVKEATPNMPIKRSDIVRAIVAELKNYSSTRWNVYSI
jgi:ribosomal protein L14